jgi:lipid A oxidase
MIIRFVAAFALAGLVPVLPTVGGELEVGVYGGINQSQDSEGTLSNGTDSQSATIDWSGKSFVPPIYYGARVTYWPDSIANWGFGVDFTHAKVYADLDGEGVAGNYNRLEFTDGMNLLTANAFYKTEIGGGLRAYAGGGVGVSIPHVEVETTDDTVVGKSNTFEYQLAGPAFQAIAGASYEFAPNWRLFGEYKLSYAVNEAQLDGGGTFSANVTTQHVLAGISYSFDAGGF